MPTNAIPAHSVPATAVAVATPVAPVVAAGIAPTAVMERTLADPAAPPPDTVTPVGTATPVEPAPAVAGPPPAEAVDAGPPPEVPARRGPDLAHMGTEELMATLEAMPASAPVALRVLEAVDSPLSDAASVSAVVDGDPSLTARLLRLANSAYYSPMSAVTTTVRAIGLVGFSAVRALAVTTAAGLVDAQVPAGFWEHSAQTAHAASLLARHFGMKSNEAFALGLLHDLGEGLMCVADADAWAAIEADVPREGPERMAVERAVYGTTHAELGARLLRAWGLPESSTTAIAEHHDDTTGGPSDVVKAAEALVEMVVGDEHRRRAEAETILRQLGVEPALVKSAARRIESEAASIVEALRS